MELFRNPNIDFLGRKWPFIIASLLLLLAGIGSLIVRGGPRYGIDFKGGALVYVKFAEKPPEDKIRSALASRLPGGVPDVQEVRGTGEVIIGADVQDEKALQETRRTIVETLAQVFGGGVSNKVDLNNGAPNEIAERLSGPLQRAGISLSGEQVLTLVNAIRGFRDRPPQSGLIRNFDQLAGVEGVTPQVLATLKQEAALAPYTIRNVEIVGPKMGSTLSRQAVLATLYALGGMLVYIGMRFEWVSGVAAVVAVIHDTLITLGLLSLFNFEITLTVVAALLTLVGYSMNDTVVLFDRVRENLRLKRREPLAILMNNSINQTLSRTLLTGGLTFLCAVSLLLFGGPVLKGFAFTFVVGIIVGTYSSIFIATPLVVLAEGTLQKRRSQTVVSAPARGTGRSTPAKTVK